jgi:hypothetical protein
MTPNRITPLAELLSQGTLLSGQGQRLQGLKALMHQIEGVVDQLGSLFGRHVKSSC